MDDPAFHARHSARWRHYRYRLQWGLATHDRGRSVPVRQSHPLWAADACWHLGRAPLDVGAMHAAAQCLVGTHDLSSFQAAGCRAPTPIRTVYALHVAEEAPFRAFCPSLSSLPRLHSVSASASPAAWSRPAAWSAFRRAGDPVQQVLLGQHPASTVVTVDVIGSAFLYHQASRPPRPAAKPSFRCHRPLTVRALRGADRRPCAQVRIMVAALARVGAGTWSAQYLADTLQVRPRRRRRKLGACCADAHAAAVFVSRAGSVADPDPGDGACLRPVSVQGRL